MWVPKDLEALISAAEDGVLDERHDFDAKRQLPTSNKELAKDIAAMTTDGGSLVYGVGEDTDGRPRVPSPIELKGAAERIDQVAQNSISGSPKVEFVHLRLPEDGSRGYLLVVIPASPEAPHQVTVDGDRRFYGRSDTGNRRLSEEEIARLYDRRAAQRRDREALLRECIERSPFGEPPKGECGFLQAFAAPVVGGEEMWEAAVEARGSEQILMKELREAAASASSARWGGPELAGAVNWRRRGADVWSLTSITSHGGEEPEARHAVRADIEMTGDAYLFYGAAAETIDRNGHPIFTLFERGIALTLSQFLGLSGGLQAAAGFHGFVDGGWRSRGSRVRSPRTRSVTFGSKIHRTASRLRRARCAATAVTYKTIRSASPASSWAASSTPQRDTTSTRSPRTSCPFPADRSLPHLAVRLPFCPLSSY